VSEPTPAVDDPVHARRYWILAVLCLSLLLVGMAMTILFLAIPDISADLDAGASDLQWIFSAYGIVFAGLVVTGGALGDRFGRKRLLGIGLVVFGLASALGSLAATPAELAGARALMGVGAALLMPGTLSIITSVFPPEERVQAIGIWSGVGGLGFILGPPLGGVLLSTFWWGSVLLVNVPVVLVALVLTVRLVPESRDLQGRGLDLVGAALSMVAIGAMVFAFIESPQRGWISTSVLGAIGLSALTVVAFARWELSHASPMLDVRLFRRADFTVPAVVITFGFFVAWGLQFLLPQYLQFIEGESVLTVGFVMATISVSWSIAAPTIPRVVARVGEQIVIAGSLAVTAAGVLCLLLVDTALTMPAVFVGLCTIGAGMGAATTPATATLVSGLPPDKAGVGSAMNDVTREFGAAFGVAVLGSILAFRFTGRVGQVVDGGTARGREAEAGINDALEVAKSIGGAKGARVRDAAEMAFTSGFRAAVLVGAALLLAVVVLVLVALPQRASEPAATP
jgi:EmrB/QacA subfamily drug resistance transporter